MVSDVRDTRGRFNSERHLHIVRGVDSVGERIPVVSEGHVTGDDGLSGRDVPARRTMSSLVRRLKRLQPVEETVVPDNTHVVYMDEWKETR